ncbi:killer cell immunoglobulin-like receptor 2DS2 isoform X2 [Cervus canadensis]|uniref:killer cell immunoglobulin-like receptor 2DS2 isoform X2 n=1 Tax=Cervus canadensis TaxID=1574408 RepID=UPI001CA3841E|nr:killer cell immunoglobulin-like receptor 2DS2 isoform X2 [Cervus canadensis]
MVEIGVLHTTDHVLWMRVQGAWGPSGQAISDRLFLLGFCVSLSIWAAVGVFTKPYISAHPGPLVQEGRDVTLRCQSQLLFDKFILHQENSTGHFQRHREMLTGGHAAADFSIGPMTSGSEGTYRCYGSLSHSPYEWSAPSDPVDIVTTGLSKKPSLTARGAGGVVRSGENVTLLCSSESAFDQFHLLREGENLGRPLAGGRGPRGALQAAFPLGPGTPAHSGAYRCYGSFTRSPYVWSDPSNPLLLSVTGSTTSTFPSPMDPHTTEEARRPQGHSSQLHLLLRLSVAFIYTSILLAVLLCHWLPKKCCNHGRRAQGRQNSEQRGRFFTTEPPGNTLNLFSAVGTEGAGVPGLETGQQDPPQSGSALAGKVVTQPRGADTDSTRV